MTRAAWLAAAIAACALGAAGPAAAQAWNGDVNLLLAGKHLDADEWGPDERQGELGIQTDVQRGGWPIALAADFLVSGHDSLIDRDGFTEQRARTTELDLGARKIWRPDERLRPYLGAGLAVASGTLQRRGPVGTVTEHDDGAGLWLGGGVFWTLGSAFNVGLDAKASGARVRLFGRDRNAGGFHLGLLLGYHWGK